MARRRPRPSPAPAVAAAVGCYAANCALGGAVAMRLVDTSGFRWLHHALYIATSATTALVLSTPLWADAARARRAAVALSPASATLIAIPFVSARTRRHPLLALTAAPLRPAD